MQSGRLLKNAPLNVSQRGSRPGGQMPMTRFLLGGARINAGRMSSHDADAMNIIALDTVARPCSQAERRTLTRPAEAARLIAITRAKPAPAQAATYACRRYGV